jgi:hypothetical protein
MFNPTIAPVACNCALPGNGPIGTVLRRRNPPPTPAHRWHDPLGYVGVKVRHLIEVGALEPLPLAEIGVSRVPRSQRASGNGLFSGPQGRV